MSREDERLDIGDAPAEHPVAIPSELPILPLRDTVLFPNSFLPLAVARESSVRLIEEAIAGSKLVGVFTQRDASVEEPAPGRSASHRHGDAHPQDVQAAGRQPAADRAGTVAAAARVGHGHAAVSARARDGGRGQRARGRSPRDRRAAAEHQDQLPARRLAVAAAVRRPAGAGDEHHRARAGSPTSSRRAWRR